MAKKKIVSIPSTLWILGLALLAAVAGAAGSAAQTADAPAEPTEESRGSVLFRLHCASCHGVDGLGNGPVAEHLETPPPDLTRIAARRGGRFSRDEIERIIDGRAELEPHGRSEMPVWGLSFQQPGRLEDQQEEVWLQIRHLVRHLRSLQVGAVTDEG